MTECKNGQVGDGLEKMRKKKKISITCVGSIEQLS
jgi:hypothetical protein